MAVACVIQLQADDLESGHTYYDVRPAFQSARPERVALFRKDRSQARNAQSGSGLQIVPFGSSSTRSKQLGQWFMFGGKSELEVAGFNAFGSLTTPFFNPDNTATYSPDLRDINPIHFNITKGVVIDANLGLYASPFHSVIQFRPRYASLGAGLMWRKYIPVCGWEDDRFWFEASTAVEYVRTNMHLTEQIITPDGVNASNVRNSSMVEAFRGLKPLALGNGDGSTADAPEITGQRWKYGKIDGKKAVTKLSDIELKLGYELFSKCSDYFEGYIGLVIPVGKKPTAEFVFEPVVGQHQFGVMGGAAFGAQIYSCEDRTVRLEVEYNGRYLFSDTQMRSFDLKNKPWSRYQMVYLAPGTDVDFPATEGINIFTQPMKVTGRFAHILNTAFVAEYCDIQCEVGYNVWARQAEKVRLKRAWQEGPGLVCVTVAPTIMGQFAEIILGADQISRDDTIGEVFSPDGVGTPFTNLTRIKESDLDLATAAHPAALSQTVYATCGYSWDCDGYPMIAALGASYEMSGINTALNRWMVWCKCGISM